MAGTTATDEAVRLLLGGRRYVILLERSYEAMRSAAAGGSAGSGWAAWDVDADRLGARLAEERRRAGLSQVRLARLAGIRVETLNRIERAKTTPDFGTVRKLVSALRRGRAETAAGGKQ